MNDQPAQAVEYLQPALLLFKQMGDRAQEVATLNNLGRAAALNQDYARALSAYEQARVIFREMKSARARGTFAGQYWSGACGRWSVRGCDRGFSTGD